MAHRAIFKVLTLVLLALLLTGCTSTESKQFTFTLNNVFYRMTNCYTVYGYPDFGGYNSRVNMLHIELNTDPVDRANADVFVGSYIRLTNTGQFTVTYSEPRILTNNTDTIKVDFIAPAASTQNLVHWFVQGNDITMVC